MKTTITNLSIMCSCTHLEKTISVCIRLIGYPYFTLDYSNLKRGTKILK